MEHQFLHDRKTFSSPDEKKEIVNNDVIDDLSKVNESRSLFNLLKGKLLFIIILLISSIAGFSQSNFILGISGGYDHSFNFLKGLPKTNADLYPDFNIGVDGSLVIGEKIRLRAELRYASLNYTRDWNFVSDLPNHLEKTAFFISNLDITPRCDYRLFSAGKLDLFVSGGLRLEFALGDFESSILANGETSSTNLISDDYTKTQAGAVGGIILKYNFDQGFGIFLSPDYTCFFDKYYSKNDYVMQRVGVNLGVEWRF
jgi:hypothetical protein